LSHGLIVFALLVTAALLVRHQILYTNMLQEKAVSLDYYIDGGTLKPFAYRVLIPQTLRAIDAVTPPSMVPVLDRWAQRIAKRGSLRGDIPQAGQNIIRSGPENRYPRAIFWLAVLQFVCLIGYALVGSSLYASLFPGTRWRLLSAPFLLVLLLPIVADGFGHIYDFSVLFLFACLLRAMASERHILYLLIFTVSCFNKETTIFVSLAYAAVFFGRLPISRYAFMLAAQVAIFMVIYFSLRASFADNPGVDMAVWVGHQLGYYLRRPPVFYLEAAVVAFVLSFRWNEKPEFLRRAMVMVLPHLILTIYAAMPGELRNSYESIPLLSMLVLRNAEFISKQWWTRSA